MGSLRRGHYTLDLLIASLAIAAMAAAGSAYARRDGAFSMPSVQDALDSFFETAFPASPSASTLDRPSLNDGRSTVSARWRYNLQAFAISDAEHAPAGGGVVFVGSSSISRWGDLEAAFPSRNIIRRGLGGARMSDCAHYADRLVLPYRPRLVVVYAGDNDLAEGVSPEEVLANYIDLVEQIHRTLPDTRIAFVSVKPSPSRAAMLAVTRRTNTLIATYTRADPRLDYVDVYTRMLDAGGHARPDLFEADALHPNAAGYAVWKAALAGHLD